MKRVKLRRLLIDFLDMDMESVEMESRKFRVVFLSAGEGSPEECETVARKLADAFHAPYQKVLASVQGGPRVLKKDLSREKAESYAALLGELGARVEIEMLDDKPPKTGKSVEDAETEPYIARADSPVTAATFKENMAVIETPTVDESPETSAADIEPQAGDMPLEAAPADIESQAGDMPLEVSLADMGPQATETTPEETAAESVCPLCGRVTLPDGTCIICRPETAQESDELPGPAIDPLSTGDGSTSSSAVPPETSPAEQQPDSAPAVPEPPPVPAEPTLESKPDEPLAGQVTQEQTGPLSEEDLSALLPPAESGICANCGGPMESDGTCLICPPEMIGSSSDTEEFTPGVESDFSDSIDLTPEEIAGGGMQIETDFTPPDLSDEVGAEAETTLSHIAASSMPAATPSDTGTAISATEAAPAIDQPTAPMKKSTPLPRMKKGGALETSPFILGLLGACALFVVLGWYLLTEDQFVKAAGLFGAALICGLISGYCLLPQIFERSGKCFRMAKPLTIVTLLLVFLIASSMITTMVVKRSALLLLNKAETMLEAEQDGNAGGRAENSDSEIHRNAEGEVLLEEEVYQAALAFDSEGENDPASALAAWQEYLDAFPEGAYVSEAREMISQWQGQKRRLDAAQAIRDRDRLGNGDPAERISDWERYSASLKRSDPDREHAASRIAYWNSRLDVAARPLLPYWISLRLADGRAFAGKVIEDDDREICMELKNKLKMYFDKEDFEILELDHISGKKVEGEKMKLAAGVKPNPGLTGGDERIAVLTEKQNCLEVYLPFRMFGFYRIELTARATPDSGGFPSIQVLLDSSQREKLLIESEDWNVYSVTFRIRPGEHRIAIVYPPQYHAARDQRSVALDRFTISIVD